MAKERDFLVVSGGQTGVDRAALDSALELGLACGGWCPRGRLAEDGVIPERYPLRETEEASYRARTERNVRDSDATLVLCWGKPTGDTALTILTARRFGKPLLIVDMAAPPTPKSVARWISESGARVINVAGPRESARPGLVYSEVKPFLDDTFASLRKISR